MILKNGVHYVAFDFQCPHGTFIFIFSSAHLLLIA